MLRIGSQKEEWALAQRGVVPVVMRGRRIRGYVRAGAEACADDGIRQSLLQAALVFTRSLPKKQPQSR